eukprot:982778-Pelagomonas_calceolata.AAC.5
MSAQVCMGAELLADGQEHAAHARPFLLDPSLLSPPKPVPCTEDIVPTYAVVRLVAPLLTGKLPVQHRLCSYIPDQTSHESLHVLNKPLQQRLLSHISKSTQRRQCGTC